MNGNFDTGVILGQPDKRIYQKVSAAGTPIHYDMGTLFWTADAPDATTNSADVLAVTTPAANSSYIGIVSAFEGVDSDADGYITIHGDARLDVKSYMELKTELTATNGSTTMNLPAFYTTNPIDNNLIQGIGRLELINVMGVSL